MPTYVGRMVELRLTDTTSDPGDEVEAIIRSITCGRSGLHQNARRSIVQVHPSNRTIPISLTAHRHRHRPRHRHGIFPSQARACRHSGCGSSSNSSCIATSDYVAGLCLPGASQSIAFSMARYSCQKPHLSTQHALGQTDHSTIDRASQPRHEAHPLSAPRW